MPPWIKLIHLFSLNPGVNPLGKKVLLRHFFGNRGSDRIYVRGDLCFVFVLPEAQNFRRPPFSEMFKNEMPENPLRWASLFIGWWDGKYKGRGRAKSDNAKRGETNLDFPRRGRGRKILVLIKFFNVPKTWFFSCFGVFWALFIFWSKGGKNIWTWYTLKKELKIKRFARVIAISVISRPPPNHK